MGTTNTNEVCNTIGEPWFYLYRPVVLRND
jgi:hypothetical protein